MFYSQPTKLWCETFNSMFKHVCECVCGGKREVVVTVAHTHTRTYIKAEIGFRKCFIICSLPKLLITTTLFHLCIPLSTPPIFFSHSPSLLHTSLFHPLCRSIWALKKSDGKKRQNLERGEGRKEWRKCVHRCGGGDLSLPVGFPFPFLEKRAFPLSSLYSVAPSLWGWGAVS